MVFDENKNKDKYNFAHILSNVGLLPFMAMHYNNHLIPQGSHFSNAAFKEVLDIGTYVCIYLVLEFEVLLTSFYTDYKVC